MDPNVPRLPGQGGMSKQDAIDQGTKKGELAAAERKRRKAAEEALQKAAEEKSSGAQGGNGGLKARKEDENWSLNDGDCGPDETVASFHFSDNRPPKGSEASRRTADTDREESGMAHSTVPSCSHLGTLDGSFE